MLVEELGGNGDDVAVVLAGANGHGPLGVNSTRVEKAEVCVNAQSHPYLADHRLDGVVLVPVVMAIEWMLRAARACRPDLTPTALRNVRVLSGIKLHSFDRGGDIFVVHCHRASIGDKTEITAELRERDGTLHYSAVVEMDTQAPAAPPTSPPPELEPWTQAEVYDGHVLFHREHFQVIQSLDGLSQAGIVGTLACGRQAGWPDGPWSMDPAVVDGGLQLAGVWTKQVLGGASLPMALGELRLYQQGLVDCAVRCLVHGRRVHNARSVCDISFSDQSGMLIAEMLEVESVLRPGEELTLSATSSTQF